MADTPAEPLTRERIEGDAAFVRFRRKLEDVVTQALNMDGYIRAQVSARDISKHCPLGQAAAFIGGFDDSGPVDAESRPYYQLGKLYRARFP